MKKNYDEKANFRNTPHLRENTIIIVMGYFFLGFNIVISGILELYVFKTGNTAMGKYNIVMGILFMLCMVPASILDNRKEMRGTSATVSLIVGHIAVCILFSFIWSFWWMAICAGEIVLCVLILYIDKRKGP